MNDVRSMWGLIVITFVVVCVSGCGTNKFEQEVMIEDATVKFAREAVSGQYADPIHVRREEAAATKASIYCCWDTMPAAPSSFDLAHIPGAVNFEFPKEPMDAWTEETMSGRTKEAYRKLLGR